MFGLLVLFLFVDNREEALPVLEEAPGRRFHFAWCMMTLFVLWQAQFSDIFLCCFSWFWWNTKMIYQEVEEILDLVFNLDVITEQYLNQCFGECLDIEKPNC